MEDALKGFNYNHLYYFYAIAKYGSLTRAADYLAVTKPTLSAQLKHLEDTLNVKLFQRKGRVLELTSEGLQVFHHAEKMFKLSDQMFQSVGRQKKVKKSRIVIGITPTVSKSFTFKALQPLFKSRSFSPYIKEASFEFLLKELRGQKVDLILSEATLNHSAIEGTDSTPLESNEYLFVGTRKYKSKIKGFPKSVDGQPFFSFTSDNNLRWEIEHYFDRNGVSVEIIGEADTIGILKSAVLAGICIAALPLWAVKDELENQSLIALGSVHDYIPHIVATYGLGADKKKLQRALEMIKKPRA